MSYFDNLYKKEWRELGFYYEYDSILKRWTFVGSTIGLSRFPQILISYTLDQTNNGLSEHIHLGPQEYLKIVTWNIPFIGEDGIYGSFEDISRLAGIFKQKLETGQDFIIDEEYSKSNKSQIFVLIKEKGFDPSSLDKSINNLVR